MARWAFGLLVILFWQPVFSQTASFSISSRVVRVPVTAFDEQGGVVPDLRREDFRLLDEGEERAIENFVIDRAPVHVLLLLDSSGSLREEIDETKKAALRFAGAFSKEDRIAAVSFADEPVLLQDWTNNFKRLRKSLNKLERGYRTALYDAVAQSIEQRFQGIGGRRVIILLTDGLDNESIIDFKKLVDQVNRADLTLYVISRTRLVADKVRDSSRVEFLNRVMRSVLREDDDFVDVFFKEKEASLTRLAEMTGGRVLFPERLEELTLVYRQIAMELKQQYVLTFEPPAGSALAFRHIEVLCEDPQVVRLNHRRQYRWESQ